MLSENFADPKSEVFYMNHEQDNQLTQRVWGKRSILVQIFPKLASKLEAGTWKW